MKYVMDVYEINRMQPIFRMHEFINANESGKAKMNVYIFAEIKNIGAGVF